MIYENAKEIYNIILSVIVHDLKKFDYNSILSNFYVNMPRKLKKTPSWKRSLKMTKEILLSN